jgi:hypothetical protein
MKEADYFTYYNKINFLKHEIEIIVTKQDEVNTAVKRVFHELEELSVYKPTSSPAQKEQSFYHEAGNPESQTPLEKVGEEG